MSSGTVTARVHGLYVSDGGVPKLPVEQAAVTSDGLAGDRQRDLRFHGGPDRAVCLLDVIERLRAEGHPIEPGSTGENVTLADVDWSTVALGSTFRFESGVELEAVSHAVPCGNIKGSFRDGDISRLSAKTCPGSSRLYARVLAGGVLRPGEQLTITGPV
jgi:MOSC domain-containing protein YiiM